ncbi:asparagine synthase (glutamine-hydrolyzing) [candidate division KSB1 bacterium]|nr:asparagine synthase (glutamine-hydrolyzing) [candidate division KSB1 bacterium]
MCGIAGIIQKSEMQSDPFKRIRTMVAIMKHRGPDGQGIYLDQQASLGHARLAIIDPEGGIQPMSNEDDSLWLVCNGEIFNYIELKKDLEKRGHRFKTRSDVEVLLHLFEEHRENLLEHLNGQYAFAIWDRQRKNLFIARDHVGICPLFYYQSKDEFIFASEIKAIIAAMPSTPSLNIKSLIQTFTFWSPLPGFTLFEHIEQLVPGCYLTLEKGIQKVKRYWQLPFPETSTDMIREIEPACEQITAAMEKAVQIRLRSDVPVGAYLSGGLDSSIITALIKRKNNNTLCTFSIGFEDAQYDEKKYQSLVSNWLDTNHSFFYCKNSDIPACLENVIRQCESPLLRSAPVPLFLLSESVRNANYKVVLTGEGSDEFFNGYNIYKETKVRLFNAKFPDSNYRHLLFQRIYPYIDGRDQRGKHYWAEFFKQDLLTNSDPFYSHRIRWRNSAFIEQFLHPDIRAIWSEYDPVQDLKHITGNDLSDLNPMERAQYLEIFVFLNGYLLSSQGDRMLMSHSIEGRYPFLDPNVIALALKIHPNLRLRVLNEKYILKKAFASFLPKAIVSRKKQPYRAPIHSAMNREIIESWMSRERMESDQIFDPAKVDVLKTKVLSSQRPISAREEMALVGLLTTTMLLQNFIKQSLMSTPQINPVIFDYRPKSCHFKGNRNVAARLLFKEC